MSEIDSIYDNPEPPSKPVACANQTGSCENGGKIPEKMLSTPIDTSGRTFCSWDCYTELNPTDGNLGIR